MSTIHQLSILAYHQIGQFAAMRQHRANYCDQARFAQQLRLLQAFDYRVLSLDQARAGLSGRLVLPRHAVVLTFDDGYESFYTTAAPRLLAYGWNATVYVISGWLGQRMHWHPPQPLRAEPELLSTEQIRELHQLGFTIGSHTHHHRHLAELPPHEQRSELADSKAALEDLIGAAVTHLCYPFGSFNATTLELAAAVGYRTATTCLRGAATTADHPLLLPRKTISFGDSWLGYLWKVRYKHAPTAELKHWRARVENGDFD
ncbi:polysaccharide deacetylase family protein [Rhodoferax sp. 4810]|uniref:Polysaccharide deacetylase family protein n=1 Tax=Thiospirillum jenense TaxID=1653858 RepID=A0A839HCZ0_9GAMM|nr:polysaccharide deacetylase family protein [Thiospirillum jenense]MBB1072953.1 polysaccharide deacetylase family protein [Rhodoferax jenense]MBB1124899.1 polysaccharide deacetylase family protein [Thiospirillum jenense]